ncbi:MAG: dihydrofolate reductase [Burkholderiaceae bacterium]|nr:dihydrofolate reductase [Burkholderiaceae bacterium]
MSQARPTLALIAAVARNGVVGRDGRLPWHIPQDMAHFKAVTAGCPVIMGRRTWDSLPPRFRPLPGRLNIVVTRQASWRADGAHSVRSLDAAVDRASQACAPGQRIFVIGGAELYAQALPLADELELTEVLRDFDGDARFPAWNREAFVEARRERHAAEGELPPFDFVTYRRSKGASQ